jgi:hypothetical protein
MGFYYGPSSDEQPEEKPPGCLDALFITRAVFAVIAPVVIAMMLILLVIGLIFVLFAQHPALALIPIALVAVGIWLYARWEQQRFRPPGL